MREINCLLIKHQLRLHIYAANVVNVHQCFLLAFGCLVWVHTWAAQASELAVSVVRADSDLESPKAVVFTLLDFTLNVSQH